MKESTDDATETAEQRRARRRKEVDDALLTLHWFLDDVPLKGAQRDSVREVLADLAIAIGDERSELDAMVAPDVWSAAVARTLERMGDEKPEVLAALDKGGDR